LTLCLRLYLSANALAALRFQDAFLIEFKTIMAFMLNGL